MRKAWRALEETQQAGDLRHLLRLGRLSALERAGHLLLELYERQSFAGLTHGPAMPMPLRQAELADHLGLSVVHVNRVLQQLRRDGFIEMQPRLVVFRKLEALAALSNYQLGAYPSAPRPRVTAFARKLAAPEPQV
jgi:CRP-like cAMP-binding protein